MSTPQRRDRNRDRDRTTTTTTPTTTPRATPRDRERNRTAEPPLPVYEPSLGPLTTTGHNAVLALLKTQSLRHLKTHLQHAGIKLTDSAGEVNERVTDARVRFQKQRERRERLAGRNKGEGGEGGENENEDGDGDGDGGEEAEEGGEVEEERNRLTSLEDRVSGITKRLEEQVRKMVDAETKVDSLVEVMGGFEKEADEASVARPAGRRVTRGERRRRRRRDEDEEGEGDDEDEDGDYEGTPESENDGDGDDDAAAVAPPSRRLEESLNQNCAQWDRQSLTQRYSGNNTYIGFYRIVHEAQHPGNDIPPVPHASTWFSHLEDPNAAPSPSSSSPKSTTTRTTTRQQHRLNRRSPSTTSSSSDIAIESERLAPKCPLTLLTFRDPVTSTKCSHSFERDAIESMLAQSQTTVPAPPPAPGTAPSRAARRIRSVKCPVCSDVLTGQDLRGDPVLLRRAKRYEARERERDDDDDDLGAGVPSSGRKRGRRSGIPVASDDDEEGEEEEGDRDDENDEGEEDEDDAEDGEDADERRRRKRQATEQVRIKQERAVSSSAPMMVD